VRQAAVLVEQRELPKTRKELLGPLENVAISSVNHACIFVGIDRPAEDCEQPSKFSDIRHGGGNGHPRWVVRPFESHQRFLESLTQNALGQRVRAECREVTKWPLFLIGICFHVSCTKPLSGKCCL